MVGLPFPANSPVQLLSPTIISAGNLPRSIGNTEHKRGRGGSGTAFINQSICCLYQIVDCNIVTQHTAAICCNRCPPSRSDIALHWVGGQQIFQINLNQHWHLIQKLNQLTHYSLSIYLQGVQQQNCSHLVICSFVGFFSCKLQKLGRFWKILQEICWDVFEKFFRKFVTW